MFLASLDQTAPVGLLGLPSIKWLLTHETPLPEVRGSHAAAADPIAEFRDRAVSLYLKQLEGGKADRRLRRTLERAFASELRDAQPETLEALDALLSWDVWNRLRVAQGCSVARAKKVLVAAVTALIGDEQGDVT